MILNVYVKNVLAMKDVVYLLRKQILKKIKIFVKKDVLFLKGIIKIWITYAKCHHIIMVLFV